MVGVGSWKGPDAVCVEDVKATGGRDDRAQFLHQTDLGDSGLSTYLLWTSYFVSECVFCFVNYVAQTDPFTRSQGKSSGVGEKTGLTGLAGFEESESKWRRLVLGW